MNDRNWMEQSRLLDCTGQVTHTLTLLWDGTVEVQIMASGVRAMVDPASRTCLTPGVHLHADLLDACAGMRPGG